ncbi:MAG: hypothetical protein U1C12_00470 [Patescibacteria group bacterium]|nr:hypothetical protein [Patescibacteria group bacterium]
MEKTMTTFAGSSSVTLILTKQHDPDAFYHTRSGLCVWNDFRSRVVAHAKPVEAGMNFKVDGFDLQQYLTDANIEVALPKEHLFGDGRLCAIIAELIARQPNGEEGALLNNGFANLFYTGSCVVGVRWIADRRRWLVRAWGRGGDRWCAGIRVFSPAN